MIWLSRYSAIFRSASYTSDWFEPGLQVPGFSRHLASRHLSRNTIFICLKQSKLFQIIQHDSTTTCSTHVFQMFRALKTVLWNARLQVWHFRHEQKIFGHPKFLWQLKKIIKFWGIRPLNLKFFWGSSPRPPQNVTPFLIPWLRAWLPIFLITHSIKGKFTLKMTPSVFLPNRLEMTHPLSAKRQGRERRNGGAAGRRSSAERLRNGLWRHASLAFHAGACDRQRS